VWPPVWQNELATKISSASHRFIDEFLVSVLFVDLFFDIPFPDNGLQFGNAGPFALP
jgi:hypothetical protein